MPAVPAPLPLPLPGHWLLVLSVAMVAVTLPLMLPALTGGVMALLLLTLMAGVLHTHHARWWVVYYLMLATSYFWAGYFGDIAADVHWDDAMAVTQLFIGYVQFIPFFALIGVWLVFPRSALNDLRRFPIFILYLAYLVGVLALNPDFTAMITLRNFSGFLVAFLLGMHYARHIDVAGFFLGILGVAMVLVVFGLFEYSLDWYFWRELFPSEFVAGIKGAGTDSQGVIGNKFVGINGVPYLRMSTVFYEPHHAGDTFAYLTLLIWPLLRDGLLPIKEARSLKLPLTLLFFACLALTLVKSAWGLFVLALLVFTLGHWSPLARILARASMTRVTVMLFLTLAVAIGLFFLYTSFGLVDTAGSHFQAMMQVTTIDSTNTLLFGMSDEVAVLNSDSGLATMIFSTGLISYILYILCLTAIVAPLLRRRTSTTLALSSLIIGWYGIIHMASAWSPMVTFILFFSAGLLVNPPAGSWRGAPA